MSFRGPGLAAIFNCYFKYFTIVAGRWNCGFAGGLEILGDVVNISMIGRKRDRS
jgi:hypothetical protein